MQCIWKRKWKKKQKTKIMRNRWDEILNGKRQHRKSKVGDVVILIQRNWQHPLWSCGDWCCTLKQSLRRSSIVVDTGGSKSQPIGHNISPLGNFFSLYTFFFFNFFFFLFYIASSTCSSSSTSLPCFFFFFS